ncbi:hypothetical protein PHYSODRAFT_336951 [Phytophthora sojae]|uniref:Uncharacterized protein n=1 Tax=Phytophthora sojae (strain P6497) TaxID=1094619 RepID=G4ZXB2_PHYSP|nr:hypothetical protein PHYSODRAFT_336951 [Phytophthora sojae]EGZ12528.1 hypothetical protein PHYSODRAFT_336951 [Phytophthora sojae]|eukprot:XP_009532861.1 hypothetical protein PHYSODRAFT_336951 [Phytophthora sojae]
MDPRELFGEEGEVNESMEGSPNRGDASPPTRRFAHTPFRHFARCATEGGAAAAAADSQSVSPALLRALRAARAHGAAVFAARAEDVPLDPVISNPLDEAQSEQVAAQMALMRSQRSELRPLLNPSTADYGFRPRDSAEACRLAFRQSLALHAIGSAARTPEEFARSTTVAEYCERLRLQAQQKSVPAMRTYPVVLSPGEDSIEYEAQFESWAKHSRKLSSMDALRASFNEVDVRIERKLRFDFAKVRAKRSLSALAQPRTQFSAARFAPSSTPAAPSREGVSAVAQGHPRRNVADPAAPQLIAGKRGMAGVPALSPRGAGNQGDQKRPRRLGNPGGGVPQTPMGSGNSHAHRAAPVEDEPSRLPTFDELRETRQQADRLRDHVHDIDAPLARCATDLDRLAECLEWLGVPREVWDRLGTLENDFVRLNGWVNYFRDREERHAREFAELQRHQALLQGQLELLARMQASPTAPPALAAPAVPAALPPAPAEPALMVAWRLRPRRPRPPRL